MPYPSYPISMMYAVYYDPKGTISYLENLKERTITQNFQLLILKHFYNPSSIETNTFKKEVTLTHTSLEKYFNSVDLEEHYHMQYEKNFYNETIGTDYQKCYADLECLLKILPSWFYGFNNDSIYLPCELAQKHHKVADHHIGDSPLNCYATITSDCPLHEKFKYHPDLDDYIEHVYNEGSGYVESNYSWCLASEAKYENYTKRYQPNFDIKPQYDWGKFPYNEWAIQSYFTFKKFNEFINYGIGYKKALNMLTEHYIKYFNVTKEKAYNHALYVLTLSVFTKNWAPIQPNNLKYLLLTGAPWSEIEQFHPHIQNPDQYLQYSIHHPQNLKKLIELGKNDPHFNINIQDVDLAKTPLMWASQHGFINSVKLLVENGANLNQQTTDLDECVGINASVSNLCVQNRQRTALMYAAQEGHEEIVRYLIAQGANKNIMDSRGKTAYHYMIGEAPWKNPYHKMTIGDGMTRPREKDDKKTLFTEKQIESLTPLLLPDIPDNEKKE